MKLQTSEDTWLFRLSRPVRVLPTDIAGALGLALLADLLVTFPTTGEAVRFLVGIPLLFFLPGYAVVSALFPARPSDDGSRFAPGDRWSRRRSLRDGTINGAERTALSLATSLMVLVFAGLVLTVTPWRFALRPLLAVLTGTVFLGGLLATVRRRRLPADRRYRVSVRTWFGRAREALRGDSRSEVLVNVLLAVAIVVAMSSLTYALAVPQDGEAFTDFYLATENETTDELVATDYPTDFTRDEPQELTIGIENHENHPVDYTVVVKLQRVDVDGGEATVLEEHELTRMETSVPDGETWTNTHEVTPTIVGEDLRLTYLLYKDQSPERADSGNADDSLHLWINVSNQES